MKPPLTFGRAFVVVAATTLAFAVQAQTNAPPATVKPAAKAAPKRAAAPEFKLVLEPRAIELLKAMSARLAAAKTMSFTAVAGYEYPSKLGPPIVYTSRYDVTMQRPDKLKVLLLGDGPLSEFYYDGKTMIAYAPTEHLVAVADAPPTIDAALKSAYDKAALFFPFTDLLFPDPYAVLTNGAILAFVVGPSTIVGGTRTDMVAWANNEIFLQVWIGSDDKLPRRLRAIFREDPAKLRHDLELSNWQIDGSIADGTFASAKAQSAPRIAFASPAGPPPGVKPLFKPSKPAAKPAQAKPQ
jgi:hypothetical protein